MSEQSEDQAQILAASRETHVTLQNKTGLTLTRTDEHIDHGIWTRNSYPPDKISAGGSGAWASESNGFMTGTEGYVKYAMGDSTLKVHWDNPFVGSNSYDSPITGSQASQYKCSHSGGDGDHAYVTFTLQSK